MDFGFFINSALLGVGLAMDAFSVSIANGLKDPGMKRARMILIAGTFAFFQFIMPLTGWLCVRFLVDAFSAFQRFIPWIALALLGYIGGRMIAEGLRPPEEKAPALSLAALLLQGVATSIDALSTGFTIADYGLAAALTASAIIAVVTFAICTVGLRIGRRFGMRLAQRSSIFGGAILIAIGLEVFLKHMLS